MQPLRLTLDEGYLLTAAPPDLKRGVAPLGPPVPMQLLLFGHGVAPPTGAPDLERGVAPLGPPVPVQLPLLGRGVAPLGLCL